MQNKIYYFLKTLYFSIKNKNDIKRVYKYIEQRDEWLEIVNVANDLKIDVFKTCNLVDYLGYKNLIKVDEWLVERING